MNTIKMYFTTYKSYLLVAIVVALISIGICFMFQKNSGTFETQSLRMNLGDTEIAQGTIPLQRGSQGLQPEPVAPVPPSDEGGEPIVRPTPQITDKQPGIPPVVPPNDSENSQGRANPRLYEIVGLLNKEQIIAHFEGMACLDNRNSLSSTPLPFEIKDTYILNWLSVKAVHQEKKCACYHNAISYRTPSGGGIEKDGAYHIKVDGKRIVLRDETYKQYCMNGLFVKNATSIELFGACLPSVSHIGYGTLGASEMIDEIALGDFNTMCSIDGDGGGNPSDPVPEFSCVLNGPDKAYSNQGFPIAIVLSNRKELVNGNYYLELTTMFDQSKSAKVTYPIQLNPVIIQQKGERVGNYIYHGEIKNKANPDKVLAACQKTVLIEQGGGDQNPRNESIGSLPQQESLPQQDGDVEVYNPQPEQVTMPLPRKLTQ